MRDHGGNPDIARARYGGEPGDWIDLSTGINPVPYPLPAMPARVWTDLPTRADSDRLIAAARAAYGTQAALLPLAGAQAAIQLVPRLTPPGAARLLAPTYNEHAAAFAANGWRVSDHDRLAGLEGADAAIVVNPNNPDGRHHTPEDLRALAATVGLLIVDESFADPHPEISLIADPPRNALILRSFGKFYGLAGVRLGIVAGATDPIARLAGMAGPWCVSGPALAVGAAALADAAWKERTVARLERDARRLDALAGVAGWHLAGGTPLFRLYDTPGAAAAQDRLARHRIWSRIFPYSDRWIRLGLPPAHGWDRLAAALA